MLLEEARIVLSAMLITDDYTWLDGVRIIVRKTLESILI